MGGSHFGGPRLGFATADLHRRPARTADQMVVVFGLGGIGLNVVQGARLAGANMIIGVDINPGRRALAEKFGMTHFVNPKDMPEAELVPYLVNLTKGGADYSFECIGNVNVMRAAL